MAEGGFESGSPLCQSNSLTTLEHSVVKFQTPALEFANIVLQTKGFQDVFYETLEFLKNLAGVSQRLRAKKVQSKAARSASQLAYWDSPPTPRVLKSIPLREGTIILT